MSITRRYGAVRHLAKAATLFFAVAVLSGAAPPPVKLLVFGDSLSAGYGLARQDGFEVRLAAALRADGHEVDILDGAVSGDTSAGGAARIDWALADGPDAAIVELGANDGLRATDPAQMEANLTTILDRLAAAHIPTLLAGMEAPRNLGAAYDSQFHDVFARLSRRPGLLFEPFFLAGVAADPALNQEDGLHPNPEGVTRVVARIKPLVEQLIGGIVPHVSGH